MQNTSTPHATACPSKKPPSPICGDQRVIMIEWVPYSDHKIKVCSQSLVDARWLPLALISKSVGTKNCSRQ